jgi:hypothetical protein
MRVSYEVCVKLFYSYNTEVFILFGVTSLYFCSNEHMVLLTKYAYICCRLCRRELHLKERIEGKNRVR